MIASATFYLAFTRKIYVACATRCHICPKMTVVQSAYSGRECVVPATSYRYPNSSKRANGNWNTCPGWSPALLQLHGPPVTPRRTCTRTGSGRGASCKTQDGNSTARPSPYSTTAQSSHSKCGSLRRRERSGRAIVLRAASTSARGQGRSTEDGAHRPAVARDSAAVVEGHGGVLVAR